MQDLMGTGIKERLRQMAEEDYRIFSSGLLPGTGNILGVRLPLLRALARNIGKGDWRGYLAAADDDFFEEIMLQGMVIGYADCDVEERLGLIRNFVPKLQNWSLCDSFCSGLKFTRGYPGLVWDFLQPCFDSDQEFEVRFAVVMLIFYFIDEVHIDGVLQRLDAVCHQGYYVKMAVAWAVSICYIEFPERSMAYLQHNSLDDFTFNKALQKITESRTIGREVKAKIRAMKRLASVDPG